MVTLFGLGPCLGARVAPQQSPILRAGHKQDNTSEFVRKDVIDERTLFRMALGLDDPWEVKEVKFDAEKQQLDIYMDFPKGSKFLCPECDQLCGVHDTTQKTWRHLIFFST